MKVKTNRYFNVKEYVTKKIKENGGWTNCHAHLDRAYTVTKDTFKLYRDMPLSQKWDFVDHVKRESTVEEIYDRMAYAVENMLSQQVTALATFIDVDDVIEDKAIKAATKLREAYKKDITIKYINQVLKGVLEPSARKWFDIGSDFVDIIGGLPGKDKGREEEHLDVLLETAKRKNKLVHVHVDQLNTAKEKETELLAKKTIEHGMQGKVAGIHGISIAAHKKEYRKELYQLMKKADLMMIACPFAWIDNPRTEELTPNHNHLTPVDELIPAGITVGVGTDNISDIYVPHIDGDMWQELRLILAGCRYTDVEQLVNIATVNGRKILGLQ